MSDIKQDILFYGGMNSDDMLEFIPEGDYLTGFNIKNLSKEGNKNSKITPRNGTKAITNSFLKASEVVHIDEETGFITYMFINNRKTVGSVRDEANNKIYYFVYEQYRLDDNFLVHNSNFYSCYEFNNSTKEIENQVFRTNIKVFDQNNFIKFGNVLYGNLFWVQKGFEPKSINIEKAINYMKFHANNMVDIRPRYFQLLAKNFDVYKMPPIVPITATYKNDDNVIINKLRGKLFQFRYRYVYDDNTESVLSPISKVPLPNGELDNSGKFKNSTEFNYIELIYNIFTEGIKEVHFFKRELDHDSGQPTAWELFERVEIDENYEYQNLKFYNNVNGRVISDNESSKLLDYVPLSASAMEVITNPDKVIYGGDIKEPMARPNIDVDIEVGFKKTTVFSKDDLPEYQEEESFTLGREHIRHELHPYKIKKHTGTLFNPRATAYYNFNGIYTALWLPEILQQGGSNLKITLKFEFGGSGLDSSAYGGYGTPITKTFDINIEGLNISSAKTVIANAINEEYNNTAWINKGNFELWVNGDPVLDYDDDDGEKYQWVRNWWAFYNTGSQFRGYRPDNPSYWRLDEQVVFIHTGEIFRRIIENVVGTFQFADISITTEGSNNWGVGNYQRVEKGTHVLGQFLLNNGIATNEILQRTYNNDTRLYSQELFVLTDSFNQDNISIYDNNIYFYNWYDFFYGGGQFSFDFRCFKVDAENHATHLTTERGTLDSPSFLLISAACIIDNETGLSVQKTLAPFGEYGVGIVYFDKYLRPSWVQECGNIYIERDGDDFSKAIKYNATLEIKHKAPNWAIYWTPVMTKNLKMQSMLNIELAVGNNITPFTLGTGADILKISVNKAITSWQTQFDNTIRQMPEYRFTEGDRVIVYNENTKTYHDLEIVRQDEDGYIYCSGLQAVTSNVVQLSTLITIYTPARQNLHTVYYELGLPMYNIHNRFHMYFENGVSYMQNTNSPLNITIDFGDIYLNAVNNYRIAVTSDDDLFQPTYNEFYRVFYPSKFNSYGRVHTPNKLLENESIPDRLRISNLSIDGTYLKAWNKFDFEDKYDVGSIYGSITGLVQIGYTLKVLTELKLISIYVNRVAPVNPDGSEALVLSDKTIGTVSIPEYDYGCKHPESIMKHNRHLYYINVDNGYVIRDSANGQIPISNYKMSSYFNKLFKLIRNDKQGKIKIFSNFNKDNGEYILIINKGSSTDDLPIDNTYNAIEFNENINRWTSFVSLMNSSSKPIEWADYVNNTAFIFLDGQLYIDDNDTENKCKILGTQRVPNVEFVVNLAPKKIKTFKAISIHATDKWDMQQSGDISIPPTTTYPNGMSSRLKPNKLRDKEGIFYSEFLGDGSSKTDYVDGLITGRELRGNVMKIKLRNTGKTNQGVLSIDKDCELFTVSVRVNYSEFSY